MLLFHHRFPPLNSRLPPLHFSPFRILLISRRCYGSNANGSSSSITIVRRCFRPARLRAAAWPTNLMRRVANSATPPHRQRSASFQRSPHHTIHNNYTLQFNNQLSPSTFPNSHFRLHFLFRPIFNYFHFPVPTFTALFHRFSTAIVGHRPPTPAVLLPPPTARSPAHQHSRQHHPPHYTAFPAIAKKKLHFLFSTRRP